MKGLHSTSQNFVDYNQLATADGKRFSDVQDSYRPTCIVSIFSAVQTDQAAKGVAGRQCIAVDTNDFFTQQFFLIYQRFRQLITLAVVGNRTDDFVFRHQVVRLLPRDSNHSVTVEYFEMDEIIRFFFVFFAGAIECGLQAGHPYRFRQVIHGHQFRRPQRAFSIRGGRNHFGLASDNPFDTFYQLRTGDFGQADTGEHDVGFIHAQPIQRGLRMVEDFQ